MRHIEAGTTSSLKPETRPFADIVAVDSVDHDRPALSTVHWTNTMRCCAERPSRADAELRQVLLRARGQ
eukprot:COSAG04_NODE_21215_length_378_cov_0.598566_1_plen_68_part_01